MKIAIIGAGWAGLSAAVFATKAGHNTTVFEASNTIGGRARALFDMEHWRLPNGRLAPLDNGQHILIGAYTETLNLMQQLGVRPQEALLSLPMTLQFPDGLGLRFTQWPTPLDALGGILQARGWSWADKWSLLRASAAWQMSGFVCQAHLTVADLCQRLSPIIRAELIDPLCVSALNTPADRACGQTFLRVLRDALLGVQGGSRLLLPRVDLNALLPNAAALYLRQHAGQLRWGERVLSLQQDGPHWQVQGENFDAVILGASAPNAAQIVIQTAQKAAPLVANQLLSWAAVAQSLHFEAIATVYAWGTGAALPQAMLALRNDENFPAQFVFDRGQLGGPAGLLAFVISATQGSRATLQRQVLTQAHAQLGLALHPVQTIVEKRATFACTPGLVRPTPDIAPGLLACGDYVAGPYPATLEGAVRSATQAVAALGAGFG